MTFLQVPGVEKVLSVAPDMELRERIVAYCDESGIDANILDFRVARSEVELPGLALSPDPPPVDVALLDGGHGSPTVFVDFCYANMMLRQGGLLLLDDVQLHSVAELARLLGQQHEWSLRADLGKLNAWTKKYGQGVLTGSRTRALHREAEQ